MPAAPRQPADSSSPPVIAIASGKGGVGKTTIAVNLAIALEELGNATTLIDADLGVANADILCGLTPSRRLRWSSAADPVSLLVPAPGGFRLLPGAAGAPRFAEAAGAGRDAVLAAVAAVERDADTVLIDTGAGVGPLVTGLVGAADLALIVTSPEPTAIADAYALIKCVCQRLGSGPAPAIGIIVNEAASASQARAVHARLAGASQRFLGLDPPLVATVRASRAIPRSTAARTPLMLAARRSPPARDIRRLASFLARSLGTLKARGQASAELTHDATNVCQHDAPHGQAMATDSWCSTAQAPALRIR